MELRRPHIEIIAALAACAALLAYLAIAPATGGSVAVAPEPPPDLAAPPQAVAPPDVGAPAPAPATRALPEPAPVAQTLAEQVPGFDGTLVTQLGRFGRMDAAQWPSRRGEPVTIPLPREISLGADAAGRLFAGVAPAALAGPGQALYVGTPADLRPAAVNVVSVAFHGAAPGRLAWLEEDDGDPSARLRLGAIDPGGVLSADPSPISDVAAGHRLAGWGDWGFLLAGWDEAAETWVAYLLDPGGAELWREPAVAADASIDGDVLLAHALPRGEFRFSLRTPDGSAAAPLGWMPPDAELGAAWSPDGARLAFVTPGASGHASRVHVRLADGTPVRSAEVPLRVAGVGWSHDGRFVLARAAEPEGRNAIFFVDTVDASVDEVEFEAWVQLAVTRPGQR